MLAVCVEAASPVSRTGGTERVRQNDFSRCRWLSAGPFVGGFGRGHCPARTNNPQELLFRRQGDRLELAIEARIPDELRKRTARPELDTARYEVAIGFDETQRQFEFKAEKFLLKKDNGTEPLQRSLFPMPPDAPKSLLTTGRNYKTVVNKVPGGNDNFYSETYPRGGKGWAPSFKLGPQKSALGNLPADVNALPVAMWFREYLSSGVQKFVLNSLAIRQASPPTRVAGFLPNGSNLPWVVERLRGEAGDRYRDWIAHLRTALTDLEEITTVERKDDRHCYMVYEYKGGLKVPSWMVSDGTLRLTALTLPAYLNDLRGIYLIEEPENGIHPRAIATAYDSLSSVYGGAGAAGNALAGSIERRRNTRRVMLRQRRDWSNRTSCSVPSIPGSNSGMAKPSSACCLHQGSWDEGSRHSCRGQGSGTRPEGIACKTRSVGHQTRRRRYLCGTGT